MIYTLTAPQPYDAFAGTFAPLPDTVIWCPDGVYGVVG